MSHLNKQTINIGEGKEFNSEYLWNTNWPPEVLRMSAYCMEKQSNDEIEWCFSWSGWMGNTSYDILQRIIDKKNSCLSFKNKTTFKWLLMVCNSSTITSTLKIHELVENETYDSNFDRVFVLDCFTDLTELKLK